jgi:hypothetical protein
VSECMCVCKYVAFFNPASRNARAAMSRHIPLCKFPLRKTSYIAFFCKLAYVFRHSAERRQSEGLRRMRRTCSRGVLAFAFIYPVLSGTQVHLVTRFLRQPAQSFNLLAFRRRRYLKGFRLGCPKPLVADIKTNGTSGKRWPTPISRWVIT